MRTREDPVLDTTSHIFICYSSKDEAVAREVVTFLEAERLRCWISVRDVQPGQNYQEAIVDALESAQGIVFLFSEQSSASGEIKKELSIGGSLSMPVFPIRLSPITPSGALRYELATRQWVDIFPDRERGLRKLAETIRHVLNNGGRSEPGALTAAGPGSDPGVPAQAPALAAVAPKSFNGAAIVRPGSEDFEALRALLARHIGPIAKVLLQKAAAEARTPEELCERLGAHVSLATERAAFLQACRAVLAKSPAKS